MDREALSKSLRLRLKLDGASHSATASVEPAESDAAAAAAISPADAEGLRAMTALVNAAWKVTPMVAMLDDPLPPGVMAQIVRPAESMSSPVIIMSRLSARMRLFNDARSVLVVDIVIRPQHGGELTLDLYEDGRIVASDGTVRAISLFDNASGDVEARRADQAQQLAKVLALFDAAPRMTVRGRSAHVLPWPE